MVIIFISGVGIGGNLFCVLVFVEGGKLDKRHIDGHALPGVEFDDDAVDGEKEVVVWLLEGLCYGVKLALVGAGVVGLRLSGHGADEV